jgi:hypothetical protein
MPKISIPEYAKREGISKVAAYKRVKTGKVKADENGLIDVEEAATQWDQNRDRIQGAKNPGGMTKRPDAPAAATHREQPEDKSSFSEAQRAREWLRVKKEKLAVEIAEGKLVSALDAERAWADAGVKIRDAVMGLPARVCNRLPDEWRREVANVLSDEARKILSALSDEIRSDPKAA